MISASAPTKIILFGEHFVVYGAPALALPIDLRNTVELSAKKGRPRLELETSYGKAEFYVNGRFSGAEALRCFGPPFMRILKEGFELEETLHAKVISGGAFKGMGNSASIAAALSGALYAYFGKKATPEELFECAQATDEIAHGGKPSGIDAKTVTLGKAIKFIRKFNPPAFEFTPTEIKFPKGTALLAIDTAKGEWETTANLIMRFAVAKGIKKKPAELTEEERSALLAPYLEIEKKIEGELREGGNARKLGELFNKNHELLAMGGVSTAEIEKARSVAIHAGALGAKLTGAGGKGGSVIALVEWKNSAHIIEKLKEAGFNSLLVSVAKEGVVISE